MPFRQRVKRVFTRSSSTSEASDGGSLKPSKTTESNTYLPHEMPVSKYRGPVDPAHRALMEGFSFQDPKTWRRNSGHSQYSPFGSRLPSRNTSRVPSRNNSVGGGPGEPWGLHLDPRKRYTAGGRGKNNVAQLVENVDESNDVANVGGTHNHTRNHSLSCLSSSVPSESTQDSTDSESQTLNAPSGTHVPFTEADIQNALMKSMSKCSNL